VASNTIKPLLAGSSAAFSWGGRKGKLLHALSIPMESRTAMEPVFMVESVLIVNDVVRRRGKSTSSPLNAIKIA